MSFVLHDFLAEHVVEGERANLLSFETPLKKQEDSTAMNSLKGDALWRWFEANGYRDLMDKYAYRSLIFALVSDMCQFVYEGLNCSAKGKLSVAFAILRKPLQDNLFYLEWILADWPDFLARFQKGPCQLDLSRSDQKKPKRVDIIARAMDRLPLGRWIDPELLYELRYEKASQLGLDPIFNQAW